MKAKNRQNTHRVHPLARVGVLFSSLSAAALPVFAEDTANNTGFTQGEMIAAVIFALLVVAAFVGGIFLHRHQHPTPTPEEKALALEKAANEEPTEED